MKKMIALMLSIIMVLGFTGCSEIEMEHFDKSMYNDLSGINEVNESIKFSIDPKVFGEAIIDISNQMEELYTVDNSYYLPESESTEEKNEFLDELINELRIALDENKMFEYSINVNGTADMDNMYSDESITCTFNNITLDCGNAYVRGNKIYIDKKLFYSIGSMSYIYDFDMLKAYYIKLDEIFGDKTYVLLNYDNLSTLDMLNSNNFAMSVVDSGNVLNEAQSVLYDQAKDVLVGFDSGCVTEIENGTRFEIKATDFQNLCDRFASYIRQHSESSANLINNYMSMVFATSASIYGDVTDDILGMQSFYDEMQVTGDDIIMAMDSFKEIVNSSEFGIIFNTLNISYTNDITEVDNKTKNYTVINGKYDNKTAFNISCDVNTSPISEYTFIDLENVDAVDYSKVLEEINNFQIEYFNSLYGDIYNYNSDYICDDCGGSFLYIYTDKCDMCGLVHDIYEYDVNCDKQPGCEIANEDVQVIA